VIVQAGGAMLATYAGASIAAAASPEIDMLERIANLDTPALLILFVVLLSRGKLRWERELIAKDKEIQLWQEAALGRTHDRERDASIAEAALARGRRLRT
jgi:hypothetical protein